MKKQLFFVVAALSLFAMAFCGACSSETPNTDGDGDNGNGETQEVWAAPVPLSSGDCGNPGVAQSTSNLGNVKETRTPATGNHDFGDGHRCSVCGYIDMSEMEKDEALEEYGYYIQDSDGSNTYTTGDFIYFGAYPQGMLDEEEDAATISDLNYGCLPTEEGAEGWVSYGYYDGGEKSDYMWYKDVEQGGEKYRAVYMTKSRPYYSHLAATEEYSTVTGSGHDANGFELNTVYWFKYEPVKWFILDYVNGQALLSATRALDSQAYQDLYVENNNAAYIPGTTTYINDWENSTVRGWLNGSFYDAAFGEEEKKAIVDTALDNKNSAKNPENTFAAAQHSTTDKIFLLSYCDLLNPLYGFTEKASYDKETQGDKINDVSAEGVADAMKRRRGYTAYAMINGVRTSSQALTVDGEDGLAWMLRSPGTTSITVCYVNKYGTVSSPTTSVGSLSTNMSDGAAHNETNGIVPSLWLKLGK